MISIFQGVLIVMLYLSSRVRPDYAHAYALHPQSCVRWIVQMCVHVLRVRIMSLVHGLRKTVLQSRLEQQALRAVVLKAVDTIGNCQRLAFTVGVSQHKHKITNLSKFELNRSSNLRENNERKNTLVTRSCVHLDS